MSFLTMLFEVAQRIAKYAERAYYMQQATASAEREFHHFLAMRFGSGGCDCDGRLLARSRRVSCTVCVAALLWSRVVVTSLRVDSRFRCVWSRLSVVSCPLLSLRRVERRLRRVRRLARRRARVVQLEADGAALRAQREQHRPVQATGHVEEDGVAGGGLETTSGTFSVPCARYITYVGYMLHVSTAALRARGRGDGRRLAERHTATRPRRMPMP